MFLSKIWFILVTLIAGVAVTGALVAPRPAVQKLEQLEGQRLDRAQYAAEQMLKVDAHRWIDYVAKLGRDAILAEALDSASRGTGELGVIHKTMKDRFRALVPELPKIGLESLVAVDTKGRVIARVGDDETEYKDSVAGVEVVADALRGYLSDDVWGAGGKLIRVAAAPVLSKARDRIVGAVYVGAETGSRLADLWKKNLGIDIAIVLRGKVVAATMPEALVAALPELVAQRTSEIAEAKRTRPILIPSGSDHLLAVVAPFVGQASQLQAYYALVGKRPAKSDIASLLSNTSADDLKWGNFPWLPIGGGFIVVLGLGLYLQRSEMEGPIGRMRTEMQQLARGEIQKIADQHYAGKLGGIARDVNAAMERYTLAPAPQSEMAGKDMNAILGDGRGPTTGGPKAFEPPAAPGRSPSGLGPPPPPAFGFPPASPFGAPPPPAFGGTPAPSAFNTPGVSAFAPPPPPAFPMSAPGGLPEPPINPGLGSLSRAFGTRPPPGPAGGLSAPPGPPRGSGAMLGKLSPQKAAPESPAKMAAVSLADAAPSLPGAALGGQPNGNDEAVKASPFQPFPSDMEDTNTDGLQTGVMDAEESHVRQVFEEYLATKKKCGEPTDGLSLEKFRVKLRDNKTALVSKYNCKTVRFAVYVKDGKAALKATPVRE